MLIGSRSSLYTDASRREFLAKQSIEDYENLRFDTSPMKTMYDFSRIQWEQASHVKNLIGWKTINLHFFPQGSRFSPEAVRCISPERQFKYENIDGASILLGSPAIHLALILCFPKQLLCFHEQLVNFLIYLYQNSLAWQPILVVG